MENLILDADFAELLLHLSDTNRNMGNLSQAYKYITQAQQITKAIDIYKYAVCIHRIGLIYNGLRDFDNEKMFSVLFNEISENLHNKENNEKNRNLLSISFLRLGDSSYRKQDFPKALYYYKEYHSIKQDLCNENTSNISLKRGLAMSFCYIGNVYFRQKDYDNSLVYYEKFNKLMQELFNMTSDMIDIIKHNLSISYHKLGVLYGVLENYDYSIELCKKALCLMDTINQNAYYNFKYIIYTCQLHTKLCNLYNELNDTFNSLIHIENAINIRLRLHTLLKQENISVSIEEAVRLAISYSKMGEIYQ